MKRTTWVALLSSALLFSVSSCAPAISQEAPDNTPLAGSEATAASRIAELASDLASLEGKYEDLQRTHASLQIDFQDLQTSYESLRDSLRESTLRDPTWSELKQFIEQDDTDTLAYTEGSFDCEGFAITLRDRAWRYGFRCAFVALNFAGTRGHALNAFETTDRGTVYVDVTEHDKIAYVQVGQPYGTVSLAAVKPEYLDCSGSPDAFWGPLTWKSHSDPFTYDYYLGYRQRLEFSNQSINAFNEAASAYNNGSTRWSPSQLNTWRDNLTALEKDLGSPVYEPISAIQTMEVYWN